MNETDRFFDELQSRLDILLTNPGDDNEATRHDQLIYPMLTSPLILDWHSSDICSQKTILVPRELAHEYTFTGGIPKVKRPDLVIKPFGVGNATVVEEKAKQIDTNRLKQFNKQLVDYMGLFNCTFGILTDGEKWIIKRGFADHFVFENLSELKKNLNDFKGLLSRSEMINRYKRTGSFDLIYFRPHTNLISNYAYKLIESSLDNYELKEIIQEISLLFLAFLDNEYTFEYKLPNVKSGTWSHSFDWKGKLNHIIEITTILSKSEKCKLINLTRYTAERNRKMSKLWSKRLGRAFDESEVFDETIRGSYLHNEEFGYRPSFDYLMNAYENEVKLFVCTGA
ncbi:MAG: hypothetical protein JSS77_03080 [Acidobacteria bacterium]|nr:hypothetical protein [Acidobacteriota bacterium]